MELTSPLFAEGRRHLQPFFCRLSLLESASYLRLLSTRDFDRIGLLCPRLTPAARSSWISPSSVTASVMCCGPGELSSTAFRA